jgi:hypothetical protein
MSAIKINAKLLYFVTACMNDTIEPLFAGGKGDDGGDTDDNKNNNTMMTLL